MVLKRGYRQTEFGVIPEDWHVIQLEECLICSPDYGLNAPAVRYNDNLPTYIRITDITDDGLFSHENITSVKHPDADKYYLNEGDIVFARTGASVGKSLLYNPKDGALVFAGFLIRVRPNPSKLLPAYLANYLKTGNYWNWVRVMSMRSGQPGINGNEYAKLPIPIPPTMDEQRAIAAALSDVDALLALLDALIAKKRLIQQGVMQELLTGKHRLPGFGGEWEVKKLGELLAYEQPSKYIVKRSEYVDKGDTPVLTAGKTFILGFTNEAGGIYQNLPVIVFDDFTLASRYVDFPFKVKSSAIKLLKTRDECHDLRFIYEKMQLIKFSIGDHKRYYISEYQHCEIEMPSIAEQKAIVAVLSDMDAEIHTLEQQRDKTRLIKQGMMQELLTGKTRLI